MIIDQITQAFALFGLGMGTVFILLSALISCVSLLSYACQRFEKNPVHAVPDIGVRLPARNGQSTTSPVTVSEEEKAIVTAAIQAHRQAKGL